MNLHIHILLSLIISCSFLSLTIHAHEDSDNNNNNNRTNNNNNNNNDNTEDTQCAIYLAPSTVPGAGRGLFAGKAFREDDLFGVFPTLLVKREDVEESRLIHYFYSNTREDYIMVIFGPGSLLNSAFPPTVVCGIYEGDLNATRARARERVGEREADEFTLAAVLPFTESTPVRCVTSDVRAGDELFSFYGEGWFETRGLPEETNLFPYAIQDSYGDEEEGIGEEEGEGEGGEQKEIITTELEYKQELHLDHLEQGQEPARLLTAKKSITDNNSHNNKQRVCLSDVRVAPSLHVTGENGLFANRDFAAHTLVTVAPVVPLYREHVAQSAQSSALMNYCFAAERSAVVLFPLNDAVMLNHAPHARTHTAHTAHASPTNASTPMPTVTAANLRMEWFSWEDDTHAVYNNAHINPADDAHIEAFPLHSPQSTLSQELLGLSADELIDRHLPAPPIDLAFYALRKIEKGEELFIDYGPAWASAWYAHNALSQSQEVEQKEPFRHFIGVPEGLFPAHWDF